VAHAAGVPGRRSPTTFRSGGSDRVGVRPPAAMCLAALRNVGRDGPRRSPGGARYGVNRDSGQVL